MRNRYLLSINTGFPISERNTTAHVEIEFEIGKIIPRFSYVGMS